MARVYPADILCQLPARRETRCYFRSRPSDVCRRVNRRRPRRQGLSGPLREVPNSEGRKCSTRGEVPRVLADDVPDLIGRDQCEGVGVDGFGDADKHSVVGIAAHHLQVMRRLLNRLHPTGSVKNGPVPIQHLRLRPPEIPALRRAPSCICRERAREIRPPRLTPPETTSGLRELAFRQLVTPDAAQSALDRLSGIGIARHVPERLYHEAYELASRLGWAKTYDAEYVALARILGAPLLTRDARLRRGAGRLATIVGPTDLVSLP